LTIDDGYSNTVFNQMLEILKAHDTTATFFLVGRILRVKNLKINADSNWLKMEMKSLITPSRIPRYRLSRE